VVQGGASTQEYWLYTESRRRMLAVSDGFVNRLKPGLQVSKHESAVVSYGAPVYARLGLTYSALAPFVQGEASAHPGLQVNTE
jgi:hypothetical protein